MSEHKGAQDTVSSCISLKKTLKGLFMYEKYLHFCLCLKKTRKCLFMLEQET